MIFFILVLLMLIWLLLFLFMRWKWNKTLDIDLLLFLFCSLLLVADILIYRTFGDNRQIGVSIVWLPIFYWLYIRNRDVSVLWRFELFNIITGCLVGILFGVIATVVITDSSKDTETPNWMLGSIFNLIQSTVAEELVFRCLLLGYLKKRISNGFLQNLIQAIIFVVFHLYGVYSHSPVLLLMPLGFALLSGFMVLRQNSIYGSLLAHVLTNLLFVVK